MLVAFINDEFNIVTAYIIKISVPAKRSKIMAETSIRKL